MDLGLKGKRALVTGSSSGLGAAAALSLAMEGVDVTINGRDRERLQRAGEEIFGVAGRRPRLAAGDVTKVEEIQRIVQEAGAIDILVSNAGGPPPGDFLQHAPERWQEAADLVLNSAVRLTRAVLEGMKARGWGRLIYITSVGVLQPIDNLILSNTYRSGVTGFCKTISNNYARFGITANCVCPGYTATDRLWDLARKTAAATGKTAGAVMESFAASNPAGRVGKPEELAALITFLASEKAAYITGTSIPIDGGLVKALI